MIQSVYDGLTQRLIRIERLTVDAGPGLPKTEDTSKQTRYSYDAAGRVSRIEYGNGGVAEVYGYTGVGQLAYKQFQHAWGTLQASWTYDAEGRPDVMTYPSGQRHRYQYDAASRNTAVVDPDGTPWLDQTTGNLVYPARYTAAYDWQGRMTQMADQGWSQSWGYNALGQMTGYGLQKDSRFVGVGYSYGATPAAGKAESIATTVSDATSQPVSSTVNYQYDSLGRLSSATAPNWSQTFSYDGFGNLLGTQSTGAAQSVSPAGAGGTFDADQHLVQRNNEAYTYDAAGLQVSRTMTANGQQTVQELTFWVGSQRLGVYQFTWNGNAYQLQYYREWGTIGGRMVRPMDRLGSDLSGGRMYLPYGLEIGLAGTATKSGYGSPDAPDGYRWATYWRDNSGLDYAQQRYYAPGTGTFLTTDPYEASAGAGNPGSWNRTA